MANNVSDGKAINYVSMAEYEQSLKKKEPLFAEQRETRACSNHGVERKEQS